MISSARIEEEGATHKIEEEAMVFIKIYLFGGMEIT
jgi:hypothetical protein